MLARQTALPAVVAFMALISLVAAAPAPGQSSSAAKIAIANPARIFNEIQETKDLKALIETKTKNLEQDRFAREQKLKDLKALRDQLKPEAPQYADRDRELRQAAIEYDTWMKVNQADMQAEQKRQMLLIFNKITAAIQEVATAKGIDLVLAEQKPDFPPNLDQINADQLRVLINSQNVLFNSPQMDISTDVITSMDSKYKSGKWRARTRAFYWIDLTMISLGDIATALDVSVNGDRSRQIRAVASLSDATGDELACLASDQYLDEFRKTRAAAVIVGRKIKFPEGAAGNVAAALLVVDDAELALAKVLAMLAPPVPRPPMGKHHTAVVAPTASIGDGARIGPHVFVGDDVRLGRNCVLHAGAYVGADTSIGDDCEFFPNVVVRERVTIGNRVIIHAGAAIGTDGFGYRWDGQRHVKVTQIGTVIIEDDVEIGWCACVDRAKFAFTRIGRGTKIDNLVQVAHNVILGPHCILAGQAGVAGSAKLGAGVVLGGQSAVRDHITMGDGSMLAACSGVMDDTKPKAIVSGLPALPHRQSLREQAALRKLPELVAEVRELQSQVEELKRLLAAKSG